jgi:hypothetical protein
LDRRKGGPQSWSGCGGEEENSHPLVGLEPQIIQLIAQCCTTKLSWLLLNLHEKYNREDGIFHTTCSLYIVTFFGLAVLMTLFLSQILEEVIVFIMST